MRLLLLLTLFLSASAHAASSMTIYNLPSPVKFDWSTPQAAYWSMRTNLMGGYPARDTEGGSIPYIRTRSIGHNYIELDCQRRGGEKVQVLNGMTMQGYPRDFRGEFHWSGGPGKYGYGILFYTYAGRFDIRPGVHEASDRQAVKTDLENRSSIAPYMSFDPEVRAQRPREALSFVRFELDDRTCLELADYYEAYRQAGGDQRYGFLVHPLTPRASSISVPVSAPVAASLWQAFLSGRTSCGPSI